MEEKKEIVIPCKHQAWGWSTSKRIVFFILGYFELERTIECAGASSQLDRFYMHRVVHDSRRMEPNVCNPLNCEECMADITTYLTSVIYHPHPDKLLADIRFRFSMYLYDGTPCPATAAVSARLQHFAIVGLVSAIKTCKDRIRLELGEKYPTVELVSYDVKNCMELHCLPHEQEQLNDDKHEWLVTWAGAQSPPPQHPKLCDDLEFVAVEDDKLNFTCSICLQEKVNKYYAEENVEVGKKRRRVMTDDASSSSNDQEEEVVVALPCKHAYHETCIRFWLDDGRNTCPLCRYRLQKVPHCAAWKPNQVSCFGYLYVSKYEPEQ